ncbi:ATP phosphoribosyltransferase regulatory subunit [Methylophilaceae bacterium]|jgi:ATP phosphoribosyltransferase regulatory subunit|nr:ATP phosphoribosyltransferase regulatory subunit [Methylophilaceae bacterium]|tara:strand:+ start:403 stop:1365 length:963 start_codon:yes stop_codon:yes gene_type:complete
MSQWLLPENVEDLLPRQAKQLEIYRRQLLDLYAKNGYELVMPSLLEYADSLNAFGKDLDLDTFKVVDQLSGKMMGVSSDLTTQASRIDSQLMKKDSINKLCYAGPIIRTKTAPTKSRELYQVGIEYFGNSDIAADIEVKKILINSLKLLNIDDITLDINHLDIYNQLKLKLDLSPEDEVNVAEALMIKDKFGLRNIFKKYNEDIVCSQLIELVDLYGDKDVLDQIVKLIPGNKEIKSIIDKLKSLYDELINTDIKISFDFSDIRGYQYHSGLIFSAYAPNYSTAIAQGGRYDNINNNYKSNRAATGFSMDLRLIINQMKV